MGFTEDIWEADALSERRLTVEQLKKILESIPEEIQETVEAGMEKAAMIVERRAKLNCHPSSTPYYKAPHITGTLQASITGIVEKEGNSIIGIIKVDGSNVNPISQSSVMEYAPFVHDGTSKMEARPFLLDAITTEQDKVIKILSESVIEALKKVSS